MSDLFYRQTKKIAGIRPAEIMNPYLIFILAVILVVILAG